MITLFWVLLGDALRQVPMVEPATSDADRQERAQLLMQIGLKLLTLARLVSHD